MHNAEQFEQDLAAVAGPGHRIPPDTPASVAKWIANPQNPSGNLGPELADYRAAMAAAKSRDLKLTVARGLGALLDHYQRSLTIGEIRELETPAGIPRLGTFGFNIIQGVFGSSDRLPSSTPEDNAGPGTSGEGAWISYV